MARSTTIKRAHAYHQPQLPVAPVRVRPPSMTLDLDFHEWASEQAVKEGISVQRWLRNRHRDMMHGALVPRGTPQGARVTYAEVAFRDVPEGTPVWIRGVAGPPHRGSRRVDQIKGIKGGEGSWHVAVTATVFVPEGIL